MTKASKRIRILCALLTASLAGCSTQPKFSGPPESAAWMRRALANPQENSAFERFHSAYHGEEKGLHAYFERALELVNSSTIYVEANESIAWDLQTIIAKIGDNRFAKALARETPETQSAVRYAMGNLKPAAKFPKTEAIFAQAPEIDFPLFRAYDGR